MRPGSVRTVKAISHLDAQALAETKQSHEVFVINLLADTLAKQGADCAVLPDSAHKAIRFADAQAIRVQRRITAITLEIAKTMPVTRVEKTSQLERNLKRKRLEDTTDHRFARGQLAAFHDAAARFAERGIAPPLRHCANSAATILWPETHADLVRVGIAAYGLWPSSETYATALQVHAQAVASARDQDAFLPVLTPALTWRARVAQVKTVPRGAYVGYGRTFRATSPMQSAVLPVGYHEGYDRRLSNLAHVLVGGVRAPVRGRVCMNMTMVDVTDAPAARPGATATLLGSDGSERVSAEQLASWMGTINYDVVSRIHPSLPRVLVA